MTSTPAVSRVWWLGAALIVAAGSAYVSLVPFAFIRPPRALTFDYVWQRMLDNRGLSRTNIVANALMLLPFGFFGAGTFVDERSRAWQWMLAAVFVLAASVALSVTIETLQIFVPGRTPSLADIEAQTVGTMIGVATWFVLGREVSALSTKFVSGSRRALEVVLFGYLFVQVLLLLQPLDVTVEPSDLAQKFRRGGIVLNPFHSPAWRWDALPSLVSDIVLAAPVGVLAAIAAVASGARRSAPIAIVLGSAFYAIAEVAQVFVRSRTADIVDLAANVLGVIAGVTLVTALTPRTAGVPTRRESSNGLLIGALVVAAMLYVGYNFSPFNFVFSSAQVASRAGMLAKAPFYAYYQNQEFKALTDGFIKLSLAAPLGVFFQLRWRPDRTAFRRLLVFGWIVLTGLFFTAVEVGQIFLPSRYPDNSDIITGMFAVWLGIRLTRPFGRAIDRGE